MLRIEEDIAVYRALDILERRTREPGSYVTEPRDMQKLVELHLKSLEHEAFLVFTLDARHSLISATTLFTGSATGAAVYVGRLVRHVLLENACAVIIAHNHPSGVADPSAADLTLTDRVRDALQLVEIRLLDHIIIGKGRFYSFAERGRL